MRQQLACDQPAERGLSLVAGDTRLPQSDLPVIANLLQKAFILPLNQANRAVHFSHVEEKFLFAFFFQLVFVGCLVVEELLRVV